MKILLVYPEYPDTFWSFKYALKFINKKAATPPLGLLTIASMIEDGNGIKLIDMNVKSIQNKDILWADYVFIIYFNWCFSKKVIEKLSAV